MCRAAHRAGRGHPRTRRTPTRRRTRSGPKPGTDCSNGVHSMLLLQRLLHQMKTTFTDDGLLITRHCQHLYQLHSPLYHHDRHHHDRHHRDRRPQHPTSLLLERAQVPQAQSSQCRVDPTPSCKVPHNRNESRQTVARAYKMSCPPRLPSSPQSATAISAPISRAAQEDQRC